MTIQERLNAIVKAGFRIAFDGCHKLYFVTSQAEAKEAKDTGYDLYPASDLPRLYKESCGLRFVHPWNLGKHPFDISQWEKQ